MADGSEGALSTATPVERSTATSEAPSADAEASEQSPSPVAATSEQTSGSDSEVTQTEAPTNDAEETMAPPGFSDPSLTLEEDAFDGPDLSLESVDLDDAGPDRVRFNLEGQGFPGWHAEYVDAADWPNELDGGSALKVILRGVNPVDMTTDAFPKVDGLKVVGGESSDGDLSVFIALEGPPAPFRVHLQHSPLRLEVDFSTGD